MIGSALAEQAGRLNRTDNVEMNEAKSRRLMKQVAAMLETIRVVDLAQANASVSTELRLVSHIRWRFCVGYPFWIQSHTTTSYLHSEVLIPLN